MESFIEELERHTRSRESFYKRERKVQVDL